MALRLAGIGSPEKKWGSLSQQMTGPAQTRRGVPVERDRSFRIVTGDSGHGLKSVTFKRKSRSRSSGTAGHVQTESAVRLPRNTQQFYTFINQRLVIVGTTHVLMIECNSSTSAVFVDEKDFFVRTNPATDKLEGAKLVEYVRNHFRT